MPLSQPVRYRVKTTDSGKKIRLAFTQKGGNVIEATSLDSGKTHTEADFKADRKRGARLKKAMIGSSSHTRNAMR